MFKLPAQELENRKQNDSRSHQRISCDKMIEPKDMITNKVALFESENRRDWKFIAIKKINSNIIVISFRGGDIATCQGSPSRYYGYYISINLRATNKITKVDLYGGNAISAYLTQKDSLKLESPNIYGVFLDYLHKVNQNRVRRMITWMAKDHVKSMNSGGELVEVLFNKLETNLLRFLMEFI
jgi:hypothetical protein